MITRDSFTSYMDLLNYKIGHTLYSLLNNQTIQNTILYGPRYSGKSLLMKTILTELYGQSSRLVGSENNQYLSHNYYTWIDCRMIQNKQIIIEITKEISKSYNYFKDSYQYIFLDHYDSVSLFNQNMFKVILEKSFHTSRFILITNKLNQIIQPIRSRCSMIRLQEPKSFDKYIHYKGLMSSFDHNILHSHCQKYSMKELNKLMIVDDGPINDDPIQVISSRIVNVLKQPFSLDQINEQCNMIKVINLPFNLLCYELLLQLSKIYTSDVMIPITEILSTYEYKLLHSYRDVIYLESMFLSIYNTIQEIE